MAANTHFKNSLLLLSYLIMYADGELDELETKAIQKICAHEGISDDELKQFLEEAKNMREKDIYYKGLEEIHYCSDEDKIRIFAWLYLISEVDGNVHVKEVRFLLYSAKKAGIEFDDVVKESKNLEEIV